MLNWHFTSIFTEQVPTNRAQPFNQPLAFLQRDGRAVRRINKKKVYLKKPVSDPTPAKDKEARKKMEEPVTSSVREQEVSDTCIFNNDLYSSQKNIEREQFSVVTDQLNT
ncbi:hypothetical protein AVEN_84114-1 [Araneus ventricosus]|uniref:Uncharacterized protein n=1 Tax=Araneus ventricosus TaxID=182803 RepID=A0A4Y2RX59_ARAVE|nr:hypothetical protein AVEN_84114-1 [Araneus ventricosus]